MMPIRPHRHGRAQRSDASTTRRAENVEARPAEADYVVQIGDSGSYKFSLPRSNDVVLVTLERITK